MIYRKQFAAVFIPAATEASREWSRTCCLERIVKMPSTADKTRREKKMLLISAAATQGRPLYFSIYFQDF